MALDVKSLLERIAGLEANATAARDLGDEVGAKRLFREALELALRFLEAGFVRERTDENQSVVRKAVGLALHCGEADRARQIVNESLSVSASGLAAETRSEFLDCSKWPEAWLVAAVRCEPPDMPALNALVNRTWQRLFTRCRLLTMDPDEANDLAQQTWVRVLRNRRELKPGGNMHAYLATIARNLWLDTFRAKRRAGPLAPDRLASLQEPQSSDSSGGIVLADILPDPAILPSYEHALLMQDVYHALEQLPPHQRDAVVSRFVSGESCASIGARHGRTEQTVTGWLRNALAELKRLLQEPVLETGARRQRKEVLEPSSRVRAT